MPELPLYQRFYYRLLGAVYGFTYWTTHHKFLGFRISLLVKLLGFVPVMISWRQNLKGQVLGLALLFGAWVLWVYWRAKRAGYKRFVAGKTAVSPTDNLIPLPPNQKIPVKASGVFGVSDREEQVLMRPAKYWRVPLGDHTVMVQPEPGRFLYQFFSADTLQNIQRGWLMHGMTPHSVLAVTFFSSWGTEPLSLRTLYQGGDDDSQNKRLRTIYLCFDDADDERAVRHTIVFDAREKRKA